MRTLGGDLLTRDEILRLVADSARDATGLIHWAGRIRTRRFGNAVRFCSIVAGKKGNCSEDCKWCAQSARYAPAKTRAAAVRTDRETIRGAARTARNNNAASRGIVNPGCRPGPDDIAAVGDAAGCVGEEGRRGKNGARLRICASLGELTGDQAAELAAAGVLHYNHNIETSRRMFPQMVTTHSYDDRLRTLSTARAAGLKLCCGGIFGIGENWDDRVDMALTLRDDVRPEVVPLNFLHPIAGTPLAGAGPLAPMDILRIIAIYRFVMPNVDIKIAGGRETNLRDLQSWIFHAGATSCLIGDYLTTAGRDASQDLQMVADLGLQIVHELPHKPIQEPAAT